MKKLIVIAAIVPAAALVSSLAAYAAVAILSMAVVVWIMRNTEGMRAPFLTHDLPWALVEGVAWPVTLAVMAAVFCYCDE